MSQRRAVRAGALGAFALVTAAGLRHFSAALALPAALPTWLGASLIAYAAIEPLRRRIEGRRLDQDPERRA
jgi:hypothetical protein